MGGTASKIKLKKASPFQPIQRIVATANRAGLSSYMFGGFEDMAMYGFVHSREVPAKTPNDTDRDFRLEWKSAPEKQLDKLPGKTLTDAVQVRSGTAATNGTIDIPLVLFGVYIITVYTRENDSFFHVTLMNRSTRRESPPLILTSPTGHGCKTMFLYSSKNPASPWSFRVSADNDTVMPFVFQTIHFPG